VRKVLGSAVRPGLGEKKKPAQATSMCGMSLARLPEHALGVWVFLRRGRSFRPFFARFC
jgi:hypothetical protein